MKQKVKEWGKRYLPAELLSVVATFVAAWLAFETTGSHLSTALAGTWAGNLAYFGYILAADVQQVQKSCRQQGLRYRLPHLYRNLRALFVEFGVAEVADSFFIRPALLYYLPKLTGNLSLGILLAKFAADITFYIPAIISYELSKRHLRRF